MTARRLTGLSASGYRYASRRALADAPVRRRLRALAERRPRWGSPRLHDRLRREGLVVNHTRTERLYREERLVVAGRRRRKRVSEPRATPPPPTRPGERWSMDDVMRDTLADGRPFRVFTVVDDVTRESPVIAADAQLSSERVIAILEQLAGSRGLPPVVVCDHGAEFTSRAVDAWAYSRGIKLLDIRPGAPAENAFVESFNGRFRDECRNEPRFLSLADGRGLIERRRRDYNSARPHSSRASRTPAELPVGCGRRLPSPDA